MSVTLQARGEVRVEMLAHGYTASEEVVAMVKKGLAAEAIEDLGGRLDLDRKTAAVLAGECPSEPGLAQ